MQFKKNRALSFVIVSLVYIGATAVGILVYRALPYSFWLNLLIADVAATIFTFLFSLIFSNASVYDPYWSVQPPVILIAFAVGKDVTLAGWLLIVAVCIWAIRLTANWAYTFLSLEHQDWRYTMLKEKTGLFYPIINFLGIHLVPTLVVYACTLPAVFVLEQAPSANIGSYLFFFLSIGAAALQCAADIQMHRFRKRDRQTRPKFIEEGLWKYSRHPNYLGEILMWWGVGLATVCVMPDKFYLLSGALLNTLLFVCVSLPMAEKRQAQKEGFAEYKARTRLLFPIKK